MPEKLKEITIPQVIGWLLMASVSINTWFVKEEISTLRKDLKEIREVQAKSDANYAALNAEFKAYQRFLDGRH